MIPTHRSHARTGSRPSISNPIPQDQYPTQSPPNSPPINTNGSRSRPPLTSTLSNTLSRNWLSRASSSSSNSSVPYAPSKPIRISEPKLSSAFDSMTSPRIGTLGSGATVVRTPQEALAGSNVSVYDRETGRKSREEIKEEEEEFQELDEQPSSPPLPPIPDLDDEEEVSSCRSTTPSRPTRPPPPVPIQEPPLTSPSTLHNIRPSLKNFSPPASEYFPPVPALPANLTSSPPQPEFEPILLSPVPTAPFNPSKIIVSLETSTMTHRTTLNTLISRPSFLSSYLQSIVPFPRQKDADEASVNSQMSDADSSFHSIFHHHLASSGVLSQNSTSIHIFLDRPSMPYAHILTYLRSPQSTPEHPAMLPRAVQLTSSSSSRLEALLELRDEARYLDLDELYKLCSDEIRLRHQTTNSLGLHSHSRGMSSTSILSTRSLGTLREIAEEEERKSLRRRSGDSGLGSGSSESPDIRSSEVGEVGWTPSSPPASSRLQQRMMLKGRSRSETRKDGAASLGSRPTGDWI